jgi:metal-sulfur cluster biosynthetic enzyme
VLSILGPAGWADDVEIENSDVYVTFTLTTPACPIGPMVFDPAWSPEMMPEDAKFALGF